MGKCNSFHFFCGAGGFGCVGLNLFQELGEVPPFAPTAPVNTDKKCKQRATAQPPKFEAPAARQLCDANRSPASPILCAISIIISAFTPDSFSAYSGVNSLYSSIIAEI